MKKCMLFVLLCATFVLRASDSDNEQMPLPCFKFGVVLFDDTVKSSSKRVTQKIAAEADKREVSDFGNLYKQLAQKDLTQLLEEEPGVCQLSEEIYEKAKQDKKWQEAFDVAARLTCQQASLEQRTQAWKRFRSLGARALLELRKEQFPEIQNPDPGSADAIIQLLERNKGVKLDEQGQKLYSAYYVMLFAVRQIHRLFDEESDRDDLLLHSNVVK